MPNTFTQQDIVLLGYSKTELRHTDSKFDVMDATTTVGLETVTTRFIYLKSRCTVNVAERVARDWSNTQRAYIVKAKSTPISIQRIESIFGDKHHVRDQGDLVWSVLSSTFSDYLQHIRDNVPQERHFISPRLLEPKIDDVLMMRLNDYLTGRSGEEDNGTLKVLSANAGVGKTTLSRQLIHTLVKSVETRKTIPIYVEAQHWQKLNITSVDGLWDVIDNSLRMFFAPTRQMTEALFHHALRQGYFCFIFDGFDELCSGATNQFEPSSILKELSRAVVESEARILLTTRTLFWKSQIGNVPDNVNVWLLDAFNSQQAKGYFVQVFGQQSSKRIAAQTLYKSMAKQAVPREKTGSIRDQFVNLPLCVRMVADYVRRGGISVNLAPGEPVVKSFLVGICERELNRQKLTTTADSQMRSFEDMALAFGDVNPFFSVGGPFSYTGWVYRR